MTNAISSRDFFDAWSLSAKSREDEIVRNWDIRRDLTYTVLNSNDALIADVARRLGLQYFCEYYRIDAVLFAEEDKVPLQSSEVCLRNIRIAFEHENDFYSGLFREVSHLLITHCDLKVLVSYPNSPDDINRELKYLHEIISGTDFRHSMSENESFLIILGWLCKENVAWYGFIYKRGRWLLIKNVHDNFESDKCYIKDSEFEITYE